jgi:hypothetical protein
MAVAIGIQDYVPVFAENLMVALSLFNDINH